MKSKLNLIALSFLMATTLSSATFASADNFGDEKEVQKSSGPSYKMRALKAIGEAAIVGGVVRTFMHGVDVNLRENDPEQLRFQTAMGVMGLSAVRSLFPEEMSMTAMLKALPKYGIKAGFTVGGAFIATSYYETLRTLSGSTDVDFEAERQERMNYAAYGAMAGNLAGNIVNTTLDGFAWGVKSLFSSVFGGTKASSSSIVSNEEELRLAAEEEERQAQIRRQAEEEERQAEIRRQAAEEEERQAEEERQEAERRRLADLSALLGDLDELGEDALNAADTSKVAREELAETSVATTTKHLNRKEVVWNGVVEETVKAHKDRSSKASVERKNKDLSVFSESYSQASTSSSSD